jgi:hypothetical protein
MTSVELILCIGVGLVLSLMIVIVGYLIAVARLEKLKNAAKLELQKAQELIVVRGQGIVKEYLSLIDWVNTDLGKEIMKTVYFDSKLLILRDKANVTDSVYVEAFESFIKNLELVIKEEVQHSVDRINKDFLQELKDKLKDERSN